LVFGVLGDNDVPTVCMVGRFHYYEGFALTQTTYPIRLMSLLGVETLIGKRSFTSLDFDSLDRASTYIHGEIKGMGEEALWIG